MPVYFEYALKTSLCLAIIFLFYTLLLKQMTYYTCNRYFLLIFSIFSFIVPFISINVLVHAPEENTFSFIDKIQPIAAHPIIVNSSNAADQLYWQILSAVWFIVSAVLFFRLLVQLLSIRKIRSKAILFVDGEAKFYNLSEPVMPFSFFNSIFINQKNYTFSELQRILDHERVHVQQKHTVDVLVTEIICILNWFNPFAWLIRNAVRQNLEFIADHAVLIKGVDKKDYQYLLLKVTGDSPASIANSFTFSSLKNRILMINKTKTSRFHLLKFVLLIPMIIFILLASRNGKENERVITGVKSTSAETFTLSALTYSIPDSKVKAIVFKEQDKCLLKAGELFNLTMISNEKTRLKNLLQRNGYNRLDSNAITFLIDSSSAEKSFSVRININIGSNWASGERYIVPDKDITENNYGHSSYFMLSEKVSIKRLFKLNNHSVKCPVYAHVSDSKITSSI